MTFKQKLSQIFREFTFPVCIAGFLLITIIVCLSAFFFLQKPTAEKAKISANDLASDLIPKSTEPTGKYPPAPKVSFDKYELATSYPTLPTTTNIYTFKVNYSKQEAADLGQKLGFKEFKQADVSSTTSVVYDNQTKESRGMLVFDCQTGSFTFQSFGAHKPKEVTGFATPQSIAQSYLSELGLWDDTLTFTTTYQLDSLPAVTLVEFHRDWDKVGLPILNIVGSLNAPENTRLAEATLASQVSTPPDNPDIINVTNGLTGKERPVDFNTVTVIVSNDGRVLTIESNLRKLAATNLVTNLNFSLKTPQEALSELEQNKGIFSLTTPTGEGTFDFDKIYPENIAHSEKATINDFVLTYLEKANGIEQKFLQPMYVFRGTSTLDSGYNVQFAQAVPAVKMEEIVGSGVDKKLEDFANKIISSVSAYIGHTHFEIPGLGEVAMSAWGKFYYIPKTTEDESRSIDEIRTLFFDALSQQYTIDVAKKLLADETLRTFVEEGPLTEEHMYEVFVKAGNCNVSKAPFVLAKCGEPWGWDSGSFFRGRMDEVAKHTAQNMIEIFTEPTPIPTLTPTPTLTITPSPTLTPTPTVAPTPTPEIFEPLSTQTTLSRLEFWAEKPDIFPENTITLTLFRNPYGSTPPECYQVGSSHDQTVCYITGTETSPAIYLYPDVPKNVTIKVKPVSKITYANPEPLNEECQMWKVSASPDGKINSNGIARQRLYYEYEKINFPEPKEGWVIERNKLDEFLSQKLFPRLGLNQNEANDLLVDVHTSLMRTENSPYLKVSFVDRATLDKYLPLTITPNADRIYRIHLMLTPLDTPLTIPKPEIVSILRNGFTVVETGVTVQ